MQPANIIRRLNDQLCKQFDVMIDNKTITVSASAGAVLVDRRVAARYSWRELIAIADARLYAAKGRGRGRMISTTVEVENNFISRVADSPEANL